MKPKFPVKYIAFSQYYSTNHQAVDIANAVTVNGKLYDNRNVYMTHDGKVITNSYASDYGYFIEYEYYENGHRFIVGDGHFDNPSELKVGQSYKQGTFINRMGNTGTSAGVHDHHRLSKNGFRVNPLDYEYVYPDQVVGSKETAKLKYYTPAIIKYRSHVQKYGWQNYVSNNQMPAYYQFLLAPPLSPVFPCTSENADRCPHGSVLARRFLFPKQVHIQYPWL